ncbi:MAG: helix-turn-helix transcriptional regulator [Coriobacteriales bacterium]|nr:helix-turn-helix transcriptional regulator [Coriobacteriales bacterium]
MAANDEVQGDKGSRTGRKAFLAHGDVPVVLLGLLSERPMHGYDMIKSLEERSGGLYKPSAGAIYPTLQMLEDQELIEAVQEGRKKTFYITDFGREYLESRSPDDSWKGMFVSEPETETIIEVVPAPGYTNILGPGGNLIPEPKSTPQEDYRLKIKDLFKLFFEAVKAAAGSSRMEHELDAYIEKTRAWLEAFIEQANSRNRR